MSNLSLFLKEINSKTPHKLVTCLKNDIDLFIEYLENSYINDTHDIEDKIKDIINNGYIYQFKINSYIELLSIKDESQSSKFLYEESLNELIQPKTLTKMFEDILLDNHNNDIRFTINIAKLNKDNSVMAEQFSQQVAHYNNNIKRISLNVFNYNINNLILSMIKVKNIIEKI